MVKLYGSKRGCLRGRECEPFGGSRCCCEYSRLFPEYPVPDTPISPTSGRIAAECNYRTQSHASAPAPELLLLVPSRTASFIVLDAYQASYLYNLWLPFQSCLYVTVTGAASSGTFEVLSPLWVVVLSHDSVCWRWEESQGFFCSQTALNL